ncbi:hypothetical protein FA95DRAFT_1047005 [Auriscalpium vulgare]|uniref:Uncharacterized protein n=2 Tax=Auriscalpium vulgare TaxID=40419 RepID=A0ACB8R296_9AGAM|nr:hypothetical protein FA95DRAFT_1289956 [Auriscalpium vulgare]KAI0052959.1 hypothetical protein FA95DRAFT_1047005 [Auriscalpium vulgare]
MKGRMQEYCVPVWQFQRICIKGELGAGNGRMYEVLIVALCDLFGDGKGDGDGDGDGDDQDTAILKPALSKATTGAGPKSTTVAQAS